VPVGVGQESEHRPLGCLHPLRGAHRSRRVDSQHDHARRGFDPPGLPNVFGRDRAHVRFRSPRSGHAGRGAACRRPHGHGGDRPDRAFGGAVPHQPALTTLPVNLASTGGRTGQCRPARTPDPPRRRLWPGGIGQDRGLFTFRRVPLRRIGSGPVAGRFGRAGPVARRVGRPEVLAQGILQPLLVQAGRFQRVAAGPVGQGHGGHAPHLVLAYLDPALPAGQGSRGPTDGQVGPQALGAHGDAQRRHRLHQPIRQPGRCRGR
jgi:hypothetical protein